MIKALWRRLLKFEPDITVGQWLWDRILGLWPTLGTVVVGGVMTYLAAITQWAKSWGPLGLGLAGLTGVLGVALTYLSLAKARSQIALSKFTEITLEAAKINPLAGEFTSLR